MERRKHQRFSATAFLNRQVIVTPIPPYIGTPIKGKLIDLSAGGMAVLIGQIIPQGTRLQLKLTFPDHTILKSDTQVKHTIPRARSYLHGLEFLTLDALTAERINRMSNDYIDCESRIHAAAPEICKGTDCAFFSMCTKPERQDLILNPGPDDIFTLDFQHKTDNVCVKPK